MKRIKFVGLGVHAETISVAVAEQGGEIRSLGVIANREESIRKLVKKLGFRTKERRVQSDLFSKRLSNHNKTQMK